MQIYKRLLLKGKAKTVVVAIVGGSGTGKTTLLKELLQGFVNYNQINARPDKSNLKKTYNKPTIEIFEDYHFMKIKNERHLRKLRNHITRKPLLRKYPLIRFITSKEICVDLQPDIIIFTSLDSMIFERLNLSKFPQFVQFRKVYEMAVLANEQYRPFIFIEKEVSNPSYLWSYATVGTYKIEVNK